LPLASLAPPSDGGVPSDYSPNQDVADLQKAMKGLGTDEKVLIEIIGRRTRAQRQLIRHEYQVQFSKDLIKEIESETSRHFKAALIGFMRTPMEVKAYHLHNSVHGLGTNEAGLIDVICLSSNHELEEVKYLYGVLFNKPLVDSIKKDTSFNFEKVLVNLLTRPRDESHIVDQEKAREDAKRIFTASEGKVGTDEATLNDILTARSPEHIQAINMNYQEFKKQHTLLQAIEKETSGHYRDALLALSMRRPAYFARRLHEAMSGLGTDDSALIYVLTALEKNEVKEVADTYKYLFNKELLAEVRGDTTGHYEQIMLATMQ
jgi:annexin A7/11